MLSIDQTAPNRQQSPSSHLLTDSRSIAEKLTQLRKDRRFTESIKNIKPGKFERDSLSRVYQDRKYYTHQLRWFIYDPSVMNVVLENSLLKKLFFNTFGYTGNLKFTIYPNCWLRDLPLLDIGEDAYLADGIVLGTNQVTPDQKFISVGRISIGNRTIFDQQCMLGYGATVGDQCIVGVRACVGVKSRIGNNTVVSGMATVGHGCKVGNNVNLGERSSVCSFAIVEDGVKLENNGVVPAFAKLTKQGMFCRRSGKRIQG